MSCVSIIDFIRKLNFSLVSISFGIGKDVSNSYDFSTIECLIPHDVIHCVIDYGNYKTIVTDEQLHEECEMCGQTFIGKYQVTDTKNLTFEPFKDQNPDFTSENIIYTIYLSHRCGVWNIDICVTIIDIGISMMFNQKFQNYKDDCFTSLCTKFDDYVKFGDSVIRLQFID